METLNIRKNHKGILQQAFAAFAVCYLCILCGSFIGYTSPAIPSIKEDDRFPEFNDNHASWIGGLAPLGALVGAVLSTFPIRIFGLRRTVAFFGAPIMIAAWLIIGVSRSMSLLLAGRFVGGIACGIIIACTPLYTMDVSSVTRRGQLGIIPQFLMTFGILLVYSFGSFLNWSALALTNCGLTVPALLLIYQAPDTPGWLLAQGRKDDAYQSLVRLHGAIEAPALFEQLQNQQTINEKKSDKFGGVRKSRINLCVVKSSAVVLGIMSFQQLTGINGVGFYAGEIFRQTPATEVWGSHIPAIVLGIVQCIAAVISASIIEKAGRKMLLLISGGLMALAALILGFYFYYGTDVNQLFWVPLVTLVLFTFAFSIGWGPVTWIVSAELLAEEVRDIMNPLAIACNWFCAFLIAFTFPLLLNQISIYGIFWMYGSIAVIGFVFTLLFVPETKGKSFQEIRSYFGDKSPIIRYSDNTIVESGESSEFSQCISETETTKMSTP